MKKNHPVVSCYWCLSGNHNDDNVVVDDLSSSENMISFQFSNQKKNNENYWGSFLDQRSVALFIDFVFQFLKHTQTPSEKEFKKNLTNTDDDDVRWHLKQSMVKPWWSSRILEESSSSSWNFTIDIFLRRRKKMDNLMMMMMMMLLLI